jgi:hypothetical protein
MRAFFYGMDAQKQRANQNKWCILRERNNIEIHGGISGGGWTGSPIPQLSGWHNIPSNTGRHGPSAAKNAGTLQ